MNNAVDKANLPESVGSTEAETNAQRKVDDCTFSKLSDDGSNGHDDRLRMKGGDRKPAVPHGAAKQG